eukprot:NODE_583_length_6431_cov_0.491788.p8 type:complete len:120 gc:universal NODE_583_length_6431_cov_0.491788:664-1023(+)
MWESTIQPPFTISSCIKSIILSSFTMYVSYKLSYPSCSLFFTTSSLIPKYFISNFFFNSWQRVDFPTPGVPHTKIFGIFRVISAPSLRALQNKSIRVIHVKSTLYLHASPKVRVITEIT